MFTIRIAFGAALLAAASTIPANAQQPADVVIADFLVGIGGKTTPASRLNGWPDYQEISVLRWRPRFAWQPPAVIGHRLFWESQKEKAGRDATETAGRARAAFDQECASKGGTVEAADSRVVREFREGQFGSLAIPSNRSGRNALKNSVVSVCSAGRDSALGGFLAMVHDNRPTEGAVWTVVHAIRGYYIPSLNGIERRERQAADEERLTQERFQQRLKEAAEFRRTVEIGTETNCGTVIQVRGPMIEMSVPDWLRAAQEPATKWYKRAEILPPRAARCGFDMRP